MEPQVNDSVPPMPTPVTSQTQTTVSTSSKFPAKWVAIIIILLLIGFLLVFALIAAMQNSGNGGLTPTPTQTTTPTTTATTTTTPTGTTEPTGTTVPTEVDIYFFNQTDFDGGAPNVYDVKTRTTTRADVATFSVEQIILGPTAAEKTEGLAATFGETDDGAQVEFTSTSNCSGKDFSISISSGKATVKFCRSTFLLGDFSGGIVQSQIADTLKQFSTIDQVRTLDKDGNCFGDLAGFTPEQCYK